MMWGGGIKRSRADALFSEWVRLRDRWTCQRCGWRADPRVSDQKARLHCSHFKSRANRRVRWEPDNAAAMCVACHDHLGKNPDAHYALWVKRLGEAGMARLQVLAETRRTIKTDEKMERIRWTQALRDLSRERDGIIVGAKSSDTFKRGGIKP